jgi:AbrB family looped-hinge helix DNA binding protein
MLATSPGLQTYPVRLRERGQITIPQSVRERLEMVEGEPLLLVELNGTLFLSRKELQVPRLADKIATMMEEAGVTLADLLEGLQDERRAIWEEHYAAAPNLRGQ